MEQASEESLRTEIGQLMEQSGGKLRLNGNGSNLAERVLRFQDMEGLSCRETGERLGLGMGQVQYLRTLTRPRRQRRVKKMGWKSIQLREPAVRSADGIEIRLPDGVVISVSTISIAVEFVRSLRE